MINTYVRLINLLSISLLISAATAATAAEEQSLESLLEKETQNSDTCRLRKDGDEDISPEMDDLAVKLVNLISDSDAKLKELGHFINIDEVSTLNDIAIKYSQPEGMPRGLLSLLEPSSKRLNPHIVHQNRKLSEAGWRILLENNKVFLYPREKKIIISSGKVVNDIMMEMNDRNKNTNWMGKLKSSFKKIAHISRSARNLVVGMLRTGKLMVHLTQAAPEFLHCMPIIGMAIVDLKKKAVPLNSMIETVGAMQSLFTLSHNEEESKKKLSKARDLISKKGTEALKPLAKQIMKSFSGKELNDHLVEEVLHRLISYLLVLVAPMINSCQAKH